MKLSRIGTAFILLGSITLVSVLARPITQHIARGFGSLNTNESQCYVVVVPPIECNLTIGRDEIDHDNTAVSIKVISPDNETFIATEITMPSSIEVRFEKRGAYKVSVTNLGDRRTGIPIGVKAMGVLETDKMMIGQSMIIMGFALVVISLLCSRVSLRHTLSSENSMRVHSITTISRLGSGFLDLSRPVWRILRQVC